MLKCQPDFRPLRKPSTELSINLCQRAFHLTHFVNRNGGTCSELGVYRGTTFCCQAGHIRRRYTGSRIIGFDSWKGLPNETSGVWTPPRHGRGDYAAPRDEVVGRLTRAGTSLHDPQFQLVDGYFSETLSEGLQTSIENVIFINADVDLYSSTIELLDFVRPLLRPGLIIYWDDWQDPVDENSEPWGERRAWDDWFGRQVGLTVETLEVNVLNQRSMIVTKIGSHALALPLPTLAEIRYHAYVLEVLHPDINPSAIQLLYEFLKGKIGQLPGVRNAIQKILN